MIRPVLPLSSTRPLVPIASLLLSLAPPPALADAVLGAPRPAGPEAEAAPERPCENTRRADNCSRVLACVGEEGLWFDGRADGWDQGALSGRLSDGRSCHGDWGYDWLGLTAAVRFACEGGLTGRARFTAQHPETGTGIGRGATNEGDEIRAWAGENVLRFLTPEGERRASLPCEAGAVPIS